MTYKDLLKLQPWLRYIDVNNISSRLLEYTQGDVFIAFNVIHSIYELHSIDSYRVTGFSQNATISPEYLNGFLYTDYRANELKKFLYEVQDKRECLTNLYDNRDNRKSDLKARLKVIERTMGMPI